MGAGGEAADDTGERIDTDDTDAGCLLAAEVRADPEESCITDYDTLL